MGGVTARRALPWLVLIGAMLAALSLRTPIISVTPVLPEIAGDLGLNGVQAGLITTAPVLMFALITPIAALVIRRAGPELALLSTLTGVLLGTVIRALPGYQSMLIGMLIIGAAITIGNVVIPVIIRRDLPPERAAVGTAVYTATMNLGSLAAALTTAPLASVIGWPTALLSWGLLTLVGLVLWIVHIMRSRAIDPAERGSGEAARIRRDDLTETFTGPLPVIVETRLAAVVRRPIVWLLLAAFGLQAATYYGVSTWLPAMLRSMTGADAAEAGAVASLFQGAAIVGAFAAPLLMRWLGGAAAAVCMGLCFAVLAAGLALMPALGWLWVSFGAIAHAAGFVLTFTALVRTSRSDAEAATMSAMVQGGGYVLATCGAPLLGGLHELMGGWQGPLWMVCGMGLVYGTILCTGMIVAGVGGRPEGRAADGAA